MKKSKKNYRQESGFTLVELIISLAFFAIASLVFIQIFIKADHVKAIAEENQNEVEIISNKLEILNSSENIDTFTKKTSPNYIYEGQGEYSFLYLLDGDYSLITADNSEIIDKEWLKDYSNNLRKTKCKNLLEINLIKEKEYRSGSLYEVKARMYKIDESREKNKILSKYFQEN